MNNSSYIPPAPQKNSGNNKTILMIVVVVVVLCCLCTAVTGGGAAAYFTLIKPKIEAANQPLFPTEEAVQVMESPFPSEETPFIEDTPVLEETPEAENLPTSTPEVSMPGSASGLGVTRAEMIDFYGSEGAFKFGEPTTIQGLEVVQGTHTWLCVGSNCAAVTLGGPEDDLLVIAIVVPTNPDDSGQTTLGILLLMTTAAKFTDAQATDVVPAQILEDITNAQKASQNLEKSIESSGYVFTESYDAQTHNAGLAISRPK